MAESASLDYVFGPVPSRRLGRSLGVDPVPFKTCNWNCVYCQLGRTTPLTNIRREYAPTAEILRQVRRVLEALGPGRVDWVTFAGSGEPTLHADLGRMIREVKALTTIPVAVLTNGALLDRPDVRAELLAADAVLPTLDAASEELYRKVNRPWPELSLVRLIQGLIAFRREYHGWLWIEVMLVKGLNDSREDLEALAAVLSEISPDEIHVNQPVRPPAEPWVEAPDEETLQRAKAILGRAARTIAPADLAVEQAGHEGVSDAVLGILSRHPMDLEELVASLKGWTAGEVSEAVATLAAHGRVRPVSRAGRRFWCRAGARFGVD